MKVGDLLPTADTVVLVREHTVRCVCGNQSLRKTLGGRHYGSILIPREIEQSRGVPDWQNHALSDLELTPVENRESQIRSFDHVPTCRRAIDYGAQVAWVHHGQRKYHTESPALTGRTDRCC